jgi:hypothetical protein
MWAIAFFLVDSREVQIFDGLDLKATRGATLGPLGMLGPIEGPKIGLVIVHVLERVDFLRGMHWVRAGLPKNFFKTQGLGLNTQVPLPRDIMSDIYAR